QLSAEIVATVREMRAREGQRVRLGDVLVVLDDAQQRAALDRAQAAIRAAQQDVAAAEADYGLAQSTLNRYQGLYDKKSVSPHEFDEVQAHAKAAAARRDAAQAGLGQARAAEAQAQAMLSYTRIRAPFDGVVTAKNVDPGTLASPGVPLLTVEDTRRFRLDATVDESDLRFVKPGAATAVVVEAAGGELAGKVAQIVPAADPASRTFVVKIELPGNAQLRSGLFGRAHFSRGARDSIVVPGTAVLDRGQMKSVYVVGADGMIDMRFITLGQRTGDKVEVLSGLTGGERLIAAPGGQDLAGRKLAN
ncbi:MAG TPA: efflux RND transporter periplasmic adaptor subunit, partial [Ramlibacter sp.]|nr:efflux RND transporter periplasmic adaptor subunit [Ramlibacter sp.]